METNVEDEQKHWSLALSIFRPPTQTHFLNVI